MEVEESVSTSDPPPPSNEPSSTAVEGVKRGGLKKHTPYKFRNHYAVDFSQQVDFDGTNPEKTHHADMTSEDMRTALLFYGKMDKDFLREVVVSSMDERELERLFCDLQSVEDDRVEASNEFVTCGKQNFDQINQRFIGVPTSCVKKFPKETFRTDVYPFKLSCPVTQDNSQNAETPGQNPSGDETSASKPTLAEMAEKMNESSQKPNYIRIGDVEVCPPELLCPQPKKAAFLTEQIVDLDPEIEERWNREISASGLQLPYEIRDSTIKHPGVKNHFVPNCIRKPGEELPENVEEMQEEVRTPEEIVPEKTDMSIIYEHILNYGEMIWADQCALYAVSQDEEFLMKIGPHGPTEKVRMSLDFPATRAFRERSSIMVNNIDHDLRYNITSCSDLNSTIKHVIVIPIKDTDNVIRAVAEFARTSTFPVPFPDDLFSTAADDITSFGYHVHRGENYRRVMNIYRVLGKRFQELFVEPKDWDVVSYKFMLIIKSQINPARVHVLRLNHAENKAVATFYDTGKYSKFGYHFDYSRQVSIPIKSTFLRSLQKKMEYVNVRHPTDAWLAGTDLQELLPGPPIRNFLAMAFTENWDKKVCEVVLLINSSGRHGFAKPERNILAAILTFWYSALGTMVFRYRMAASSKPLKCESDLFYNLINDDPANVKKLMQLSNQKCDVPKDFCSFDFYCKPYLKDHFLLPRLFIWMMDNLVGADAFHREKLASFVLAVREGYRDVSYHTWHHGFHVAHCLFVIFKTNPGLLTDLEIKAILVAGLCHDLDHQGCNTAFTKKYVTPLEKLYPTSPLEHLHVRETFRLLACSENDILVNWPESDKAEFAYVVKQAILSTDFTKHFSSKKIMEALLEKGLHLDNQEHRQKFINLLMTAADLSASAKPWETQMEYSNDLYDEFYYQGDLEKLNGERPVPMHDRETSHNIPRQQAGFLKHACLPLYSMLARTLPNTQHLVDACQTNIVKWEEEVGKMENKTTNEESAHGSHPHGHSHNKHKGHTSQHPESATGHHKHRDHDKSHHRHHEPEPVPEPAVLTPPQE